MRYSIAYIFSNLARNRERYILFGVLFFILGGVWLLSLTLGQAAQAVRADMLDNYATLVTVKNVAPGVVLYEKETYDSFNVPELVQSMEYLSYSCANANIRVSKTSVLNGASIMGYNFSLGIDPLTRQFDPVPLVRGRMIEADDECLIFEDNFQEIMENRESSISKGWPYVEGIGDTITLKIFEGEYIAGTSQMGDHVDHQLKIVGTIDRSLMGAEFAQIVLESSMPGGTTQTFSNSTPWIFTTMSFSEQALSPKQEAEKTENANSNPAEQWNAEIGEILAEEQQFKRYQVLFRLHRAEYFDAFAELVEAHEMKQLSTLLKTDYIRWKVLRKQAGLSEDAVEWEDFFHSALISQAFGGKLQRYRASLFIEDFDELVAPLEQLGRNSAIMTLFLAALAVGLVMLLTVLNLHARTYEIGVLRCIGMSKLRIDIQLLAETMVLILLSFGGGVLCAGLIAKHLIPTQFDAVYIAEANSISVLTPALQVMGSGVLFAALATLGSAIYIQRFRPLAILRNRS